ncbi:MAG: phosphatidate cytidylyltransferase [Paludibacteraceae bacterium]|nr:phosphatidate cytidylyltransferase [Paludibacteraceae bacterium]
MNAKLKNFITRVLSGAVFVSLTIGSLLFCSTAFTVLFALFVAIGLYEFHHATNKDEHIAVPTWSAIIAGVLLFLAFFQQASGQEGPSLFAIYALWLMGTLLAELFRKKEKPIHNLAYLILGQLYVATPMAMLSQLLYANDATWQSAWVLVMLLTIWVNDSFAYLFGILFGKHRMFERISPKKSWEGFIGGALMSLGFGIACYYYLPQFFPSCTPTLTLWQWMLLAELIVATATLGDLLESLMKRSLGIKDYGNIMPGHGGVLDRFDSLLTSVIALWAFLALL